MTEIQMSGDLKNLEEIEKKLTEAIALRVGWFPSAVYKDGEEEGLPVATVAAIQEKGAPSRKIPPRPFLGPAAEKNKKEWSKIFNDKIQKMSLRETFDSLGLRAAADVAKQITEVFEPPIKERTVKTHLRRYAQFKNKKKITEADLQKEGISIRKPLVDTGYMLASVSYEVD